MKKSEFKLSTLVLITLYFLALSQSQERICKCSETTDIDFSQNTNSLQDRTFWKWLEQEE